MEIVARIQQDVQRLAPAAQAEVLDFVAYLLAKAARADDHAVSEFSLASAMRGMEDEELPPFSVADLKEKFG